MGWGSLGEGRGRFLVFSRGYRFDLYYVFCFVVSIYVGGREREDLARMRYSVVRGTR